MYCSIGKQLGVLLAQYEETLYRGGDDLDLLKKVALISEMYRNFTLGQKPGFEVEFDAGYAEELEDLQSEAKERPSKRQLLGDYLGPEVPGKG